MRAMQFVGPGHPLLVPVQVPDPVAKPGWVVIDVEAAGMCHSDVGIVDGPGVGWLSHYPIILGHEVAGTVSALGEGVTGFEVGDRVAVCLRQGRDEDYAVLGRTLIWARTAAARRACTSMAAMPRNAWCGPRA
ncbi:alcohol dehydrogenase catalytic domain-containing protein [Brevundimonas diminuta]|uniref:alcohol dehydrogenase catalytic domain-containing protein n=1 Tax=Brevundimonas diminuta TaxID=293 RepID=UPI003D9A8223